MAWQTHPSIVPLSLGACFLAINALYLVGKRTAGNRAPGQLLAAGLVASFAISIGAFAAELASTELGVKLFWNQIQYVGDAPLIGFLLGYVLVYTGYDLSRRDYALLFFLPAVVLVSVFTNPIHHLHWTGYELETLGGYVVLDNHSGPTFYLYILYTYAFLVAGLALLVRTAFHSDGRHRTHVAAVAVGLVVPALAGILYVLEVGPTPTPNYPGYSYLVTAGLFTYSVHRRDLFTVVPIARRTTIEQMDAAVLTVDDSDIVLAANDAARAIFDGDLLGQNARIVLEEFAAAIDLDGGHQETTVETDAGVFNVTVQPLVRAESVVGRLLILRDVTDRHRREQQLKELNTRLEVLNRIVRHDIRNDMDIVLGYARHVADAVDDEDAQRALDNMVANGEHVVELTDILGDLMETMLDDATATAPLELPPILRQELDAVRAMDDTVVLDTPEDVPSVTVQADEMLATVFRNLLTNAVRHNDSETPTLSVAVTEEDDTVTVRIADDGPGIPDSQRDEIFGRGEKGLESPGTGIGLYLVDTLVDGYDGDVWVEDPDEESRLDGAVFVVRLQKPSSVGVGPARATE